MALQKRVAVLRCAELPSFVTWDIQDVDGLFSDDDLLIEELTRQGVHARSVIWRDPNIDWSEFDLALIRSTWDYIDQRESFLSVLADIEGSSCTLLNPLEAVQWNSDKTYLFDLAHWGVPTVPTYSASQSGPGLMEIVAREEWSGAVLKPRIGAGGAHVQRIPAHELSKSLQRVSVQRATDEFLVQPLLECVITEGEWSFIYVNGELGHVLLKKPAVGDFRAHGIYGGTIESAQPSPRDLSEADAIRGSLPLDLLYARLDLVRVGDRMSVLELELIEPMLYLDMSPSTARRLAAGAIARINGPSEAH